MNDQLWDALIGVAKDTHAELMRDIGAVIPPTLFALREGRLLGYVRLRPVYVGKDAQNDIAEMSIFAAAANADEIVVAWETQDIATACDLVPLHPDSAVNVLAADSDGYRLQRLPYQEEPLAGRASHGQIPCRPGGCPSRSTSRAGA